MNPTQMKACKARLKAARGAAAAAEFQRRMDEGDRLIKAAWAARKSAWNLYSQHVPKKRK